MNWLNPFNTGYSVLSTTILSLVALVGTWLVWKLIKKIKIKIDKKAALAVIPWVLLTAGIRVMRDARILHSTLFTSPWLYATSSLVTITVVFTTYLIDKKNYWKFSASVAFTGFLITLFILPFKTLLPLLYLLIFLLPWILFLYNFVQMGKLSKENFLVLLAQLYDANVTATGIQYFGYASKHVVPTAVILSIGPFGFILVKFFVTLFVLLILDKKLKQKNLRNYIKLLIALFALLTGSRDLLRGLCSI